MRVELPQLAGAPVAHLRQKFSTALSDGTRVDTASPHNGAHSAGTQLLSAHGAGAMPGSASPRIGVQRDLKMSSSAGGEDDDENDALIERSGGDASPGGEKPGGPSALYEGAVTVAYCVVYLLVGPALILTNKQIMRDVGSDAALYLRFQRMVIKLLLPMSLTNMLILAPLHAGAGTEGGSSSAAVGEEASSSGAITRFMRDTSAHNIPAHSWVLWLAGWARLRLAHGPRLRREGGSPTARPPPV